MRFSLSVLILTIIRGVTHMTSTLRGWGDKAKMRCYQTFGGWEASECSGRPMLFFLLKEIGFTP